MLKINGNVVTPKVIRGAKIIGLSGTEAERVALGENRFDKFSQFVSDGVNQGNKSERKGIFSKRKLRAILKKVIPDVKVKIHKADTFELSYGNSNNSLNMYHLYMPYKSSKKALDVNQVSALQCFGLGVGKILQKSTNPKFNARATFFSNLPKDKLNAYVRFYSEHFQQVTLKESNPEQYKANLSSAIEDFFDKSSFYLEDRVEALQILRDNLKQDKIALKDSFKLLKDFAKSKVELEKVQNNENIIFNYGFRFDDNLSVVNDKLKLYLNKGRKINSIKYKTY